jgi:N-methylhydantoinase A
VKLVVAAFSCADCLDGSACCGSDLTKSRKALLGGVDPAEIDAILRELETHARTALTEDGFTPEQIALERAAALHYQGQSFELEVPAPPGAIDRTTLVALEEAYGVEHEKTYGHPRRRRRAG